jgi:dihydrofolate synthase/folylpolyglutamate synthase
MSYAAAIDNLSALIPELFSAPGQPRRKFSLAEIGILCAALGDPQKQFPSVLIAGTNGKGSTASTLASIARQAGLRVGLYTSPHLDRVNERIRLLQPSLPPSLGVDIAVSMGAGLDTKAGARGLDPETGDTTNVGAPSFSRTMPGGWETTNQDPTEIPDESFARLYFRVHDAGQQLVLDHELPAFPSYFELLTALAFAYFAESRVDLAVLEVGMGGRLDATNIVEPILSVITDISLDHQEWLGSTIALIAREKAGILRPNGTLVTLPQHPEANQAIGEVATELDVRGVSAAQFMPQIGASPIDPYPIQVLGAQILVDSPLKGVHQHRNIALAVAAAVELGQNHNFPITPAAVEQGIHNTRWPGRLERITLPNQPEFVLDVAHNPAGAWALRAALSSSLNPGDPDLNVGENPGVNRVENPGAPGLASETWDTTNPGAPGPAPETGGPHTVPGLPSPDDRGHQLLRIDSAEGDSQHAQCLIFACLRDKPLREMTQILFPIFDHVVLAPIHSPRATEVADLLAAAEATGVPSTPSNTVEEAIQIALSLNPARIVISGSVYLVGEARHCLLAQNQEPNR